MVRGSFARRLRSSFARGAFELAAAAPPLAGYQTPHTRHPFRAPDYPLMGKVNCFNGFLMAITWQ